MNIFITGASVGFGAAIASRFVRAGHRVVVTGRRLDRLQRMVDEFGADSVNALALDVRDADAVARAIDTLPEPFSAIDVLVNNAGLAIGLEPAQAASIDAWETMVGTNIKGVVYLTHAVLPGMAARNRGHIINLGSAAATYPYPGGNVYGATKASVRQFSLNLKADLLGTRVRTTTLDPGLCGGTEFSVVRFRGDQERANQVYRGVEALTPDDIAEVVFWTATLPSRININTIELMPTSQAFAPLAVSRSTP